MKRFIFFTAALLFFLTTDAQNIADFENLSVPESGYFNGSSEHSGTLGQTESFNYESGPFVFSVSYTPENGYDYWSEIGYSNQTDMNTADWTNFSAYANLPDGGGFEDSQNYAVGYFWDPLQLTLTEGNEDLQISGLYVCNHVWTYHYMNGSDGDGSGTFETGDYYKLIFTDNNENSVEFFLADFTGDNAYIIEDWTYVDLSELSGSNISISYEASDSYTPAYFCMDNITADETAGNSETIENSLTVFPNPAKQFINITDVNKGSKISIRDISGRLILKTAANRTNKIDISNLTSGVYILKDANTGRSRKFIKQ
jgi:hypothetical protein